MSTVYVSIGNSDDKLSQRRWRSLVNYVFAEVAGLSEVDGHEVVYGRWYSHSADRYQNACIAAEVNDLDALRAILSEYAASFHQESIALATAQTEFISPRIPEVTP